MKKIIVIVLIVVLLVIAVVSALATVSQNVSYNNSANVYMKYAEDQIKLGGYGSAIDYIKAAIKVEATAERYYRLAEVYKLAGNSKGYTETLTQLTSAFPKEKEAYRALANYYYDTLAYKDCVKTLQAANAAGAIDAEMTNQYYEVAYRVNVVSAVFKEAHRFYGSLALVGLDDSVCYVNTSMQNRLGNFADASPAGSSVLAVYLDDHWCFINDSGLRYVETDMALERAWSYSGNLALVKTAQGYYYLNNHGTASLGPYTNACSFYDGVAAVSVEGVWQLINTAGQPIGETKFQQVLINEDNYCSCGGVIFASTGNGYDMYGTDGKLIAATGFEDAETFFTDDYAAVKRDGKWGFVDKTGKMILEPQFAGARSFGHSVGAVCNDAGLWGFITKSGRVVIDYQYEDAKAFSTSGYAPIKTSAGWMYIRIG